MINIIDSFVLLIVFGGDGNTNVKISKCEPICRDQHVEDVSLLDADSFVPFTIYFTYGNIQLSYDNDRGQIFWEDPLYDIFYDAVSFLGFGTRTQNGLWYFNTFCAQQISQRCDELFTYASDTYSWGLPQLEGPEIMIDLSVKAKRGAEIVLSLTQGPPGDILYSISKYR